MEENRLKEISDTLLYALLNNPYESLILIDADGIVRFVSDSNETIKNEVRDSAVGKHISAVNPDSGLIRTVQTGKAEMGRSLVLHDRERIVARIPLMKSGQVVGAAGKLLLSSPEKVKALFQRIDSLEKQLDYYKAAFKQVYGANFTFEHIVGQSESIRHAKAQAQQAARSDSSVVISGESGTGKEMFAHAIHDASRRSGNNFIRINCSAIPADLIEAELFGYEPGAFTGAGRKGVAGKIELAHNGTLFLDEIGEMPLAMQVKLLRVLQDRVVERIGGGRPRQINFRIISATNRDLEDMIRRGTFRLDLYYRLNVMNIQLPPLRAIAEDIPLIFHAVLDALDNAALRRRVTVSEDAMALLSGYGWPGNVRELRNAAERALIVCSGDRIETVDLPQPLRHTIPESDTTVADARPLKVILAEAERKAIFAALKQTDNNKVKAAELLGIHRTGLYQKLRKYS